MEKIKKAHHKLPHVDLSIVEDQPPYSWRNIRVLMCSSLENVKQNVHFDKFVFPQLQDWCKKWKLCLLDTQLYSIETFIDFIDHCSRNDREVVTIAVLLLDQQQIEFKLLNTHQDLLPVHSLICLDAQDDLVLFAIKVKEDMQNVISTLFQQRLEVLWTKQQDKWQKESYLHDVFAQMHTRLFVGRESLLNTIFQYIHSNSRDILAIYGEEGIGKSALVARVYQELESKYSDKIAAIAHFAGSSRDSLGLPFLWQRLCCELKKLYNIERKIPSEKEKWAMLFRGFLHKVTKPTVILIDGINDFHWLPNFLPQQVKIVIAVTGKRHIETYQKRIRPIEIFPLQKKEIISIVQQTLPHLANLEKLLSEQKTSNPLYLKFILREFANSLDKVYPQTIIDFFVHVLNRLEKEFDPELVKALCCLIQAAQHGLTTKDLQQLLLDIDENYAYQFILYQLSNYLYFSENLVYFFRQGFSQAIKQKYSPQEREFWQQFLTRYFQTEKAI